MGVKAGFFFLQAEVVEDTGEKFLLNTKSRGRPPLSWGRPVGVYLRQCVERAGHAVALQVWGPSCYSAQGSRPLDRLECHAARRPLEAHCAKPPFPRALRQGPVAQPRLAKSGAAWRALPEQWRAQFGYRPLLAESFTVPETYAGTCYKASNWEPVGFSAGYSRPRADFYVAHERPKRLWLRELFPRARAQLRAAQLPENSRAGLVAPPSGVLPLLNS